MLGRDDDSARVIACTEFHSRPGVTLRSLTTWPTGDPRVVARRLELVTESSHHARRRIKDTAGRAPEGHWHASPRSRSPPADEAHGPIARPRARPPWACSGCLFGAESADAPMSRGAKPGERRGGKRPPYPYDTVRQNPTASNARQPLPHRQGFPELLVKFHPIRASISLTAIRCSSNRSHFRCRAIRPPCPLASAESAGSCRWKAGRLPSGVCSAA
jgi:hypothetical protein